MHGPTCIFWASLTPFSLQCCGDGLCDGPETQANCAADCAVPNVSCQRLAQIVGQLVNLVAAMSRHAPIFNSARYAQEECTTLTIGMGPVVGQSFAVAPGYTCPTVVNRDNWLSKGAYGDTYAVTQAGGSVSVVRTDTGNTAEGWDMNLKFECCGETLLAFTIYNLELAHVYCWPPPMGAVLRLYIGYTLAASVVAYVILRLRMIFNPMLSRLTRFGPCGCDCSCGGPGGVDDRLCGRGGDGAVRDKSDRHCRKTAT
jgi:hypothetical protein